MDNVQSNEVDELKLDYYEPEMYSQLIESTDQNEKATKHAFWQDLLDDSKKLRRMMRSLCIFIPKRIGEYMSRENPDNYKRAIKRMYDENRRMFIRKSRQQILGSDYAEHPNVNFDFIDEVLDSNNIRSPYYMENDINQDSSP